MPDRRTHDVAKEHFAKAARDAARIERRERRHHVVGRAKRIVLVAVLDVRDAVPIEEPRIEIDPREELRVVDLRAARGATRAQENFSKIALHVVPVKLDVVIAVDERERVSLRDQLRERFEDVWVARGDAAQFRARVIRRVAETVRALFVVERGREANRSTSGSTDMPMKSMKSPAMTTRQRAAPSGGAVAR